MTTATERIPVLMTKTEKSRIAKRAKDAGLSMGEFLRRAAAAFGPSHDDAALEAMIGQMLKSTKAASRAIDDAVAYVERSNKRMAAMETKRGVKAA
jgi:hypothetical protein